MVLLAPVVLALLAMLMVAMKFMFFIKMVLCIFVGPVPCSAPPLSRSSRFEIPTLGDDLLMP